MILREERPPGEARAPGVLTLFACGCESKLGPCRQGGRCSPAAQPSCGGTGRALWGLHSESWAMAGVTQQYCRGPLTPWAHGQHLRGCGWLGSGTTFLQGTGVLGGVAPQPCLAWWGSCAVYLEGDWRNAGMKFCPTIPSRPQPDWDSGLVIQAQRPGEFSRGLVRKQGTRSHLTTNCLAQRRTHTRKSQGQSQVVETPHLQK